MPTSLSQVAQGRSARFVRVTRGRGLAMRLAAMGLVPGAEIKVMRNQYAGPFIVLVSGTRLILGRGMANHILVEAEDVPSTPAPMSE